MHGGPPEGKIANSLIVIWPMKMINVQLHAVVSRCDLWKMLYNQVAVQLGGDDGQAYPCTLKRQEDATNPVTDADQKDLRATPRSNVFCNFAGLLTSLEGGGCAVPHVVAWNCACASQGLPVSWSSWQRCRYGHVSSEPQASQRVVSSGRSSPLSDMFSFALALSFSLFLPFLFLSPPLGRPLSHVSAHGCLFAWDFFLTFLDFACILG